MRLQASWQPGTATPTSSLPLWTRSTSTARSKKVKIRYKGNQIMTILFLDLLLFISITVKKQLWINMQWDLFPWPRSDSKQFFPLLSSYSTILILWSLGQGCGCEAEIPLWMNSILNNFEVIHLVFGASQIQRIWLWITLKNTKYFKRKVGDQYTLEEINILPDR